MMQAQPATFGRVVGNVKGLLAARGESPYPTVIVQFLLDRGNYRELPRMYELGRSLDADRIAIGLVLDIPRKRIDPARLLRADEGEILRPYVESVLALDKSDRRLQIDLPLPAWNSMLAEIRARLGYEDAPVAHPIASSFQEKNGHCFFGWYTATIRGNGDLYPCCLLMFPDYKPLGNALNGRFVDHWNGPEFTRLRREQRDVLLAGDDAVFDRGRHHVIRRQCVEPGQCWLKNVYFRHDEEFYSELATALEPLRRRRRWTSGIRRVRNRVFRLAGRTLLELRRYRGASRRQDGAELRERHGG
jgi:MoaA/NifB/PqqE/SkfB family radical SAM enzyme